MFSYQMRIRIFNNGTAYVSEQVLPVEPIGNGLFLIPLLASSVVGDSLLTSEEILITNKQIATVYKGANMYRGVLGSYDSSTVTLTASGVRTILRDYDRIQIPEYIVAQTASGTVPDELVVSYNTNAIRGTISHNLDVGTSILTTNLVIENDLSVDIDDARIEVVTTEEEPMLFRASLEFADTAMAAPVESPTGTVYVLPGMYDIPAGYEATLPVTRNEIDGEISYVIDAPNGTTQARYTLTWSSPVDLPPGTLYVYRNGVLETTTSIGATGARQERVLTLVRVASVYAQGTIARSVIDEEGTTRVRLDGTLFNTLSDTISVQLRYNIGNADADVPDSVLVQRDGPYLLFPFTIEPNDQQPYDITFTILPS